MLLLRAVVMGAMGYRSVGRVGGVEGFLMILVKEGLDRMSARAGCALRGH